VDASVFAGCWMLGFAHRDGSLRRLGAGRAVPLAGVAIAAGVAWALAHPAGDDGIDLNDIPLGQALVSLGAVLLLLRYSPRLAWLERVPGLGRLVTVITARVVTIYLWHNVAIALAELIDARLGWPSTGALIGTSVLLTAVLALGLGWVEDLAAGRRPALIPGPDQPALRRRAPRRPAPAPPVIGDGGLALPAETRESPLAAANALRPASEFRHDPRFAGATPVPTASRSLRRDPVPQRAAAPGSLPPGRVPGVRPAPSAPFRAAPVPTTTRVPDTRPAGPPSRPGTAVRAAAPDRPPGRPDDEAVTGVVDRTATGRRRLLSFGEDEGPETGPAPGRHASRADTTTPTARRGSHRDEGAGPVTRHPGTPSRHRR
jgi:hypothetical protein